MLAPDAASLAERERARPKTGYGGDFTPQAMDAGLRSDTPPLGYWLDSTGQAPEETVADLLDHLEQAAVPLSGS